MRTTILFSSISHKVLLIPDVPFSEDRFVLAIQTKFQQDMYQQYASTVICIDSTHKTNVYDFKLITLMVIDEYGEGKLKYMYIST